MATKKCVNIRNPAVKRIMKEFQEFQRDPSSDFVAEPCEDNLFEWHFTLRGGSGTEFEGGRYHGRILLPSEYPFKPPDIVLLTPSGRFTVNEKICLSISGYHPKNWQPSWSIRTVLIALQAFFPTPANGAIGSLDWPKAERQACAKKSSEWYCSLCKKKNIEMLPDIPSKSNDSTDSTNSTNSTDSTDSTDSKANNATEKKELSNINISEIKFEHSSVKNQNGNTQTGSSPSSLPLIPLSEVAASPLLPTPATDTITTTTDTIISSSEEPASSAPFIDTNTSNERIRNSLRMKGSPHPDEEVANGKNNNSMGSEESVNDSERNNGHKNNNSVDRMESSASVSHTHVNRSNARRGRTMNHRSRAPFTNNFVFRYFESMSDERLANLTVIITFVIIIILLRKFVDSLQRTSFFGRFN